MQKRKFAIGKRTFLAWCIATVLLSIVLTIAVLLDFETSSGLFVYGSVLGKISLTLLAVAAVCGVVWYFAPLQVTQNSYQSSLSVRIAAGLLAGIGVAIFVSGMLKTNTTLQKFSLVMLVPAIVYFALLAANRGLSVQPICAFTPILFASLYLISLYFDMSQPLNGEMRILEQMALVGALLVMLCDVRRYLGTAPPRLQLTANAICMVLSTAYGVSTIAMQISPDHTVPLARLLVGAFLLAYAVYGGLRAWTMFFCTEQVKTCGDETEQVDA